MELAVALTILVIIMMAAVLIFLSGFYKIKPYEQAIVLRLGRYKATYSQGPHFFPPLINQVIIVDLRTEPIDVPKQEVITKDNSPVEVDAVVFIKVVEPKKAIFEVTNYKLASIALAQTNLRSIIGDMELDEILYNRLRINTELRDILDMATDPWGVKVEKVEIREVDPVGTVKAAMEEQTASERQRRAAILKAEGVKRAAILNAEGEKRSAVLSAEGQKKARILSAEGLRQAKILEAEGERRELILESQGKAQGLRITALGAAPLDQKALTVLSLRTVEKMSDGKASKIIFPFEFSRLLEGAAEYIGATRTVPERERSTIEDMEKVVGKIDDILGPIPKAEEIKAELDAMTKQIEEEAKEGGELPPVEKKKIPPQGEKEIEMESEK